MDGRVQILLAMLTVVGSGVSSGFVVYFLNSRKEHVFFMRNKVEETCAAAIEYVDAVGQGSIVFQRIIADEKFELMPEYLKLYTWNAKLRANIRIYFPHLLKELDALHGIGIELQDVNAEFFDHIGKQQAHVLLAEHMRRYGTVNERFARQFEALLKGIESEARKYSGEEAFRVVRIPERVAQVWRRNTVS
jgi:hypothetical protein